MNAKKTFGILAASSRHARGGFALAGLSVMGATFFSLVDPIVIRIALDTALGGMPLAAPAWFAFLFSPFGGPGFLGKSVAACALTVVSLNVFQGFFLFLKGFFAVRASETTARNLREDLYRALSGLPYLFFSKADSGDLIQRCTSDVDTLRRFLESQVVEVARAVFMIGFSAAIMFSLDLRMSLASMVLVPPVFLWSYLFFRRVQKGFRESDEAESALSSVVQENLHGVRVVRAFAREEFEEKRFDEKNARYRDVTRRLINMLGTYWSVSAGISMAQMAITLCMGGYWAAKGELSLGTVIMFFTYVGRFLWPIRQMGRTLTEFGKATVALERMGHIILRQSEYATDGRLEPELKGRIEFKNVRFGYDPAKPVLDGLSFCVRPGETVAVLGKTGSGKSSLVHLIPRFADVNSGAILLDGVDLRFIKKECLRSQVGIVLQEPFLFSKTLEDNLLLGRPESDRIEVEAAARAACLYGVVADFEKGWQTQIGEEGVTLSGGQRQRAAIARTLLQKPRILILDDSLSAVDTETDAIIRAELEKRRGDMTVIVIAHRVTTLAGADRILVMDGGRVADSGTHEELIARPGLYRSIWRIQSAQQSEEDGALIDVDELEPLDA
jgi:ATP-binding cassette, subfamily B, bacterial